MQYIKIYILLIFILVTSLLISILKTHEFFDNNYKYTLSLLVICKNEGMVINEFIQHYKWQDVDHVYLIDNDSTDNMKEILTPYINQGYVSYYFLPEQHNQVEHYNTVYNEIRNDTRWLIVCDADEYIYNRQPNTTLKTYLNNLSDTINAVIIPWKMFGSSGYKNQPNSIRKSFIWKKEESKSLDKTIIQTKNVKSLGIHDHNYVENTTAIKHPQELALNHYAIMSEEYFKKVKMTRGDVHHKEASFQRIRDMTYFSQYDYKDIQDEELKNLLG